MSFKKKKRSGMSRFLVIYLILIILFVLLIAYQRYSFNNKVFTSDNENAYLTYSVYPRGGNTDSWTKTFANGDKIYGKIFEVALGNYSGYDIAPWSLRIDITQNCWINNAWNGTVEIHQFVEEEEKVQTLYLLDCDYRDVTLQNSYDTGDLLIDLREGDYIIYYPSEELYEAPILKHNGHSTIGLIFYTINSIDNNLTDEQATVSFHYNRKFNEGVDFVILIAVTILWFILLIIHMINLTIEQKKRDEANQAELEAAYAEANRANEAKTKFLANMSHEIRTPINAILGMNTMILRESNQDEIKQYASDIEASGKTLLSIINDILDLSKVESGKMELINAEYDISDIIRNLASMIDLKAKEKNLKLNLDINENLPRGLYGDEIRIKQIILNILNNAVKYTKEGSVTLKVDYDSISSEQILLKVSVKDTGIGIKEEDINKLFAPYERIEEERNKNIEGTGLGMSITKRLLSLMDSQLDVKSTYGVGSIFSFEIVQLVTKSEPIGNISYSNNKNKAGVAKESYHAPKAKILVTDDVKMNLVVIKSLLKRIQCQVDTCESGEEALKLATKNHYNIIFIDHMMPDMDGIETLNRMNRECQINANTPKIALTANAISGIREEYLKAGFNDYLSKPVEGEILERMIYNYLPKNLVEESFGEEVNKQSKNQISTLADIPDINIEQGMKFCGSMKIYTRILQIFVESVDEEDETIQGFADKLDYENYTIEVHGLKSSAKTIGVQGLADMALELEMAGKNKNGEKITKDTPKLLEEHKRIATLVEEALKQGAE